MVFDRISSLTLHKLVVENVLCSNSNSENLSSYDLGRVGLNNCGLVSVAESQYDQISSLLCSTRIYEVIIEQESP